ncbi:hypothetical protein IV203_035697 [Nitzschia inconspicua]|uniref:Uncharacterized protein n=1 Tax=Nitzschia inconspicua TaxID=303405 RepID=A0A9K3PV21_9STRA|nr:hypothetical protein IV203_035697 [Nitzschia inconspicua]
MTLLPEGSDRVVTGSMIRFCLSTVPFLAVLVYFIYTAYHRPHFYSQQVEGDDEPLMSLMDILIVFLLFHVLWTLFTVYLVFYIPKRRRFLGRYLDEGETTLGDVIFDESSRMKVLCCRLSYQDHGYAVYPHPNNPHGHVVRKRVRIYQPYTRERVAIVRLPNRPLSGQPKMEIEMDLSLMKKERDTTIKFMTFVSIAWILFALAGAVYTLIQMTRSQDQGFVVGNENAVLGRRLLVVVVGLNVPFCLLCNFIRFLVWRNWMINRGAILENEGDARKLQPTCLYTASSADGSEDAIPYSIMGEDHSYTGTLYSHSATIVANRNKATSGSTVEMNRNMSKKPSTVHLMPMGSLEHESSLV